MRYIAQWPYWSNLCIQYGTGRLEEGTAVDLEPEVADAFNRDSPGVLVEDKPAPARQKVEPSHDRMVHEPAATRAAQPRKTKKTSA